MTAFRRRGVHLFDGELLIANLFTIADRPEERYVVDDVVYEVRSCGPLYRSWDATEGWDVQVQRVP